MEQQKIYSSIIGVMNDIEAIGKNKKNAQQGYSFRGIDDMYNAVHPLFAKHRIFITSEVLNFQREERETKSGGTMFTTMIDVKFSFYAEDGSSVSSVMRGEAMDSGDKGSNKAQSAALKYALMQMFLIPTEDMEDADKTTPPETGPKKPAQPQQPKQPTPEKTNEYDIKVLCENFLKCKTDVELEAAAKDVRDKYTLFPEDHKELGRIYVACKKELKTRGAA